MASKVVESIAIFGIVGAIAGSQIWPPQGAVWGLIGGIIIGFFVGTYW